MSNIAIAQTDETLDALCYRLGVDSSRVEEVYTMNPGLAAQGPILQQGTAVNMPDTATAKRTAQQLINLWD
ncbi:hypothetical protein LMG33818_002628 [Halomonadaceae bacterium LMG 33818]|uniref:tail protein X n=1 Tax=Cernens ardua TaxID=3402176 RepID=UPI003EDC9FC1